MSPGSLASAVVIDDAHMAEHKHAPKDGTDVVAGHDSFLFVAKGHGTYRINGHEGILAPNTLIAAPAGTIACSLLDEPELYVVAVRDRSVTLDDQRGFIPFFEHRLSADEGRRWRARMADSADRALRGRFGEADIAQLKDAALPYIWQRDSRAAQETLRDLFSFIWENLATPLSLERLASDAGYTANYLNDLARVHTGRSLGRWITDMRMARARVALEQTDMPVAEVGVACGYDDPAYFSRVFRRALGASPATWRLAARPVDARHRRVAIALDEFHQAELSRQIPERSYSFAS